MLSTSEEMDWDKTIAFVNDWIDTLKIASFITLLIVILLVFLQPFDTYQSQITYKEVKLMGYGLCILVPYILMHILERKWYLISNYNWRVSTEVIFMLLFVIIISLIAYIYHNLVFTDNALRFNLFGSFFLTFILPFTPILLPFLVYLRQFYGKKNNLDKEPSTHKSLHKIYGSNQEEEIILNSSDFLFAKADQNYMELYLIDQNEKLEKKIIRSTLYNLLHQLPFAKQVHRSYLINPHYLITIEGNSRKRIIRMKYSDELIPLSNTYYKFLMQKHP